MRSKKLLHQVGILLGAAVLASAAVPASAVTVVAGTVFADNAFADTAVYGPFSFDTGGCGGAVTPDILIGPRLADCVFANEVGAYATVGFTDNVVVNGLGDDIRIYELGIPDNFAVSLTIGGTTVTKTPIATGFTSLGFSVNAANWDLSTDF